MMKLFLTAKQRLLNVFALSLFITVGLTVYFWGSSRALFPTSQAQSEGGCSASIELVPKPENGKVAPGRIYDVQVVAKMGGQSLMTGVVTLNYDADKLTLDESQMYTGEGGLNDGNRIILPTNYQLSDGLSKNPRSDDPLDLGSGIFELRNINEAGDGKINILASCEADEDGSCANAPTGDVLLATVPFKILAADQDTTSINVARSGSCGDYENNQSAVVAWDAGLDNPIESTTDVLGSVSQAITFDVSTAMRLDMLVDGQIKADDFNTYRCNFINDFFGGNLACDATVSSQDLDTGGDNAVGASDFNTYRCNFINQFFGGNLSCGVVQ